MTTTLERLDRMERDISRLNQEVLELRAALTHAGAPQATPLRVAPQAPHRSVSRRARERRTPGAGG